MADVLMQSPTNPVNGSEINGAPLLKFAATDIILPPPDLKSQPLVSYLSDCIANLVFQQQLSTRQQFMSLVRRLDSNLRTDYERVVVRIPSFRF